ncbi:MAG: transposase [Anaerolineaceae bacterium]|nr:transposase [Anaerolineaceae bacterium]
MASEHFIEPDRSTFYGKYIYDRVVSKDHFFRKRNEMLLVAYLYNLSERQTERYINDSMSAKYFLELGMDQFAPDHSTLTKFKRRMIERKRELKLKNLLADINTSKEDIRNRGNNRYPIIHLPEQLPHAERYNENKIGLRCAKKSFGGCFLSL